MSASPSEETLTSFNRLVYEYLLKMKLTKSAEAFRSECNVGEIHLNDSIPVLLNWYNIFLETADVRSGKIHSPAALNRIEGIMMKLENEKSRCIKMSSVLPQVEAKTILDSSPDLTTSSPPQQKKRIQSPAKPPLGTPVQTQSKPTTPRYRSHPEQTEIPGSKTPAQVSQYGHLKETKRMELNIPFIFVAKYCQVSRIFVCCCADGKVYFYNVGKRCVDFSCYLPHRQVKGLKILETYDSIFLLMDFVDNSILLSRYFSGQKEDLYIFRLEEPVRSYCFGKNTVLMLTETSVLHILSFSGEILRTIKVPTTVFAIDFSGKNVLMLEPSRVVEFDLGINAEIKTLGRGTHPTLFVKEEYVFLSFSDSIQVFNRQSLFPIIMVKSSLVPRDIDLIFSRVVVASGNEIYSGNDIVPLPNTIVVANFVIQDTPLLMALTSEGALVFFTINCINEYA